MLKNLLNLPFKVTGRLARAVQRREDAAHVERPAVPERPLSGVPGLDVPADFAPDDLAITADALAGATLVDLRDVEVHAAGTIPGAMSMPLAELGIRLAELPPAGTRVVVFGTSDAETAARFLRYRGIEEVWYLTGGLEAWEAMR